MKTTVVRDTAIAAALMMLPLSPYFSSACFAQAKPAASTAAAPSAVSPPAAAPAAPGRTVTVAVTRPGSYQLFAPGKGDVTAFPSTDKPTVTFSAPLEKSEADIVDQTAGTVAVISVPAGKGGANLSVTPADFKYVGTVTVPVTAATGGKPVATGAVVLTDAAGHSQSHLLTPEDKGVVSFTNVLLGKATITASAGGAVSARSTQETIIAPAKGGGAVSVPVTLTGNVMTLDTPASAPAGAPIAAAAAAAPAPVEPPANNWIPGVIGLALLAGGIYYGIRKMKERGVTVEDALKKMGVEMPQDGASGTLAAPLKAVPAAPLLPPLPSLSELPAAGPAKNGVHSAYSAAASAGTATAVRTATQLVGLAGAVEGEKFLLNAGEAFTVGRDDVNSLALTSDTGVSRRHARVERSDDGWQVVDTGSSNGTYVNGKKVVGAETLRSGDEIQIGGARFRFEG